MNAAYGIDTDSFLNTFYRIVSPPGLPTNVLSDSETNSIGAKNELQELGAYLEKRCKRTLQAMVINDTSIHPFPLISPHFSGVHGLFRTLWTVQVLIPAEVGEESKNLFAIFVMAERVVAQFEHRAEVISGLGEFPRRRRSYCDVTGLS